VLSRDLLRVKTEDKSIRPSWIDRERPPYLDLADKLLVLHGGARGWTRGRIEEAVTGIVLESAWPKMVRGLAHTLIEGAHFEAVDREELEGRRRCLFLEAARSRVAGTYVREKVIDRSAKLLELDSSTLEEDLYRDLPLEARLLRVSPVQAPVDLIDAYNDLLTTTLLAESVRVECTIEAGETRIPPELMERVLDPKTPLDWKRLEGGAFGLHAQAASKKSRFPRGAAELLGMILAALRNETDWQLEGTVRWKRRSYALALPGSRS
jgi:hypothetical protein